MAKAEKQAEAGQFEDEHVPSSNGQLGTSCLLQSCSAEDVALLTSQVRPQHCMQLPASPLQRGELLMYTSATPIPHATCACHDSTAWRLHCSTPGCPCTQAVTLFSSSLDQAAEEIGLQAAELEQAVTPQPVSGDQMPLSKDLCSTLQAWLRRKALEILPQRAPLLSTQPGMKRDEEVPESGKQDGSSPALGIEAELQSNAEQHGGPQGFAVGCSKEGDQLDQRPQGTAAGETCGQSHDQLQRSELLDAGIASDRPPAADVLRGSLQPVPGYPDMSAEALAVSDQPTFSLPQTLAPSGGDDRAEPSQPAVVDGLAGAGERAPSEPTQADSAAVQIDAPSDVQSELLPTMLAPVVKQQSSEPADGQASLAGPPSVQQPATETGTGQQALQAGAELPLSSAPAVSASKAVKQTAESGDAALSCLPCSVTSMTPDQAAKLGTWAAWQEALRAAPAAAPAAAADDEAMHPYTRRLLACPPSQYVLQPERLDENR